MIIITTKKSQLEAGRFRICLSLLPVFLYDELDKVLDLFFLCR